MKAERSTTTSSKDMVNIFAKQGKEFARNHTFAVLCHLTRRACREPGWSQSCRACLLDSFDADRSKGGRSHETYQPFVFDDCRSPQYPVFVVLVDVVVIAILVVAIVIPDICQFWYTIALFGPKKAKIRNI